MSLVPQPFPKSDKSMNINFLAFLSFTLNGALLLYIVTYHPKPPNQVPNNLIERVYEEPYREKFDQKSRLQAGDLSTNVIHVKLES